MTKNIVGHKIIGIRKMTESELITEGWDGYNGVAIVLDSGAVLYPSRDPEGNGPGALFGSYDNEQFGIRP